MSGMGIQSVRFPFLAVLKKSPLILTAAKQQTIFNPELSTEKNMDSSYAETGNGKRIDHRMFRGRR